MCSSRSASLSVDTPRARVILKPFFVYMLECADGTYHVGHTDELALRVAQHEAGEIPGYTRERRPVRLVWSQETASRDEALAAERRIKGWGRAKKEALIVGDRERIGELARSRSSTPVRPEPVEGLSRQILCGNTTQRRRAIAKSITLLESTRSDHRAQADELLNTLLPHTGRSLRLGISGVPGVGKSTFIEALGLHLIAQGHKVAVLAIDPSSTVSGGSILGDKTRMERLSTSEHAYIRPSPSGGTLGGVAEKTRESMLVLEAAGHDIVIVETVGVGQSETAVAAMTDMFVLLQLPNAGDDLQAIKKGVMELADLVAINKADIDPDAARRAGAQIASALRLFGQHGNPAHSAHDDTLWHPQVLELSGLKSLGLDDFWTAVTRFQSLQKTSGRFSERRRRQNRAWMWERIEAGLKARFRADPHVKAALTAVSADVDAGTLAASVAARRLLDLMN